MKVKAGDLKPGQLVVGPYGPLKVVSRFSNGLQVEPTDGPTQGMAGKLLCGWDTLFELVEVV